MRSSRYSISGRTSTQGLGVNRVEIRSSEFLRSVQSFGSIRVAVIGDVMLDIWLEGSVRRISQEAPIPVVELTGREESPGGAANVAELLASLEQQFLYWELSGTTMRRQPLGRLSGPKMSLHGLWGTKGGLRQPRHASSLELSRSAE